MQHDNWNIQQTRNCATAMTGEIQGTPLANQNVAYDASSSLVTKASGFADFFTNTHTALCGVITACSLKLSGCSTDYTAGNLVIDATTGAITAKQNVDAGYADTVCIKCQNTHSSFVTHDNWVVTQAPNCATLTAASVTA